MKVIKGHMSRYAYTTKTAVSISERWNENTRLETAEVNTFKTAMTTEYAYILSLSLHFLGEIHIHIPTPPRTQYYTMSMMSQLRSRWRR